MTLSEHERKILELGDAWKLAQDEVNEFFDKLASISCTGYCAVNFDDNANLTINYTIYKKEEDETKFEGKGDQNDE